MIKPSGRKGGNSVQIEVKIDAAAQETKVIVQAPCMTEEVQGILRLLSEKENKMIAGFKEDTVSILEEDAILRIYAAGGKVYAVLPQGEYVLRRRIYEMEEQLKPHRFVRISNAEIINLRKVKKFDLSFAGTICVTLEDNSVTYVSRRYVTKIKEVLGV